MKEGKGINKMSLVPGFVSGDLTAHIRHRKSRLQYRMVFVKDNLGIHRARSIQPTFRPVRPGKRTTSKGGPVFSKLFRLDRTDPLSFGPKFPEILVEWIAPIVHGFYEQHMINMQIFKELNEKYSICRITQSIS